MNGSRVFIDSNIMLALFDGNQKKKAIAASLAKQNHIISTQVVNENVAVCLKKLKFSKAEAFSHGVFLLGCFNIVQIAQSTILYAFMISNKYGYSFWDSLILSTALESNCSTIYSEDMQDGQIIEERLVIINPFSKV